MNPASPELLYQGLLASVASWARVGRGYLAALVAAGRPAVALSVRGFRHDPDFPLPIGLVLTSLAELDAAPLPDIGWGFVHPPTLERLIGRRRVPLFVWESDRVPHDWLAPLAACDQVLVPSRFVADALVATGLPASHVAIVPYGHSLTPTPRPPVAEAAVCTFLFVGAPHWRKGLRELLTAWRQAFRAGDAVRLLIKSSYDPGNARRRARFEISSWAELLRACGVDDRAAPVEFDLATHSDADMPSVYGQGDVLVAPSWGEGFGLGILEAAASGLPVITTNWSAAPEFLPAGPDLLPYELASAGELGSYLPVEGAHVALPSIEALTERLRWHAHEREASRTAGTHLAEHVKNWTWTAAGEQLWRTLTVSGSSE